MKRLSLPAPNSGKSAFLDQVMVLLAKNHGWKFGVISMEKPNIELHVVAELMQRTTRTFLE